ncbi:MAG: NAD(P)/FAD-dependent oxidoreductase [Bacteroidetes bacterium]|nr:NAD(P)/FAD-dependent oxidoreductase [Bacteroidota bacterium]
MSNHKIRNITIIGAGLVGSLLAIFLAKRGYKVTVYERRPDMRRGGEFGGRSINLALSNRGWWPLEQAGVADEVREMIIPMKGRMIHDLNSELTFQPYGKEGQFINSVSRAGLNMLLINNAESQGAKFNFEHFCLDVDLENTIVKLENSSQVKNVSSDLIIGADGAFSAVRFAMQMTDRFNYSQQYIDHGYKELTIPAGKNGEFQLEKNALHIWPRGNYMLIALPNQDASFTCTLFFPFEGDPSFSSLKNTNQVEKFFNTTFPDAVPLLKSMPAEFFQNPTSSLVTVKCYPWVKDKVLIIGDAAHAIVPFYGQGMNVGFEDCRILNGLIEEFVENWDEILLAYQKNRKPDGDAISSLALKNFIEMRDLVGDSNFILRKKIEARLHESYPDKWIPLYSMVTFNEKLRYSEAERIGKIQKKIMDQVMMTSDIEKSWEKLDFGKIVEKLDIP